MYAAKIIGNAVCTVKEHRLTGLKLLVVQPLSLPGMEEDGRPVVAVDTVGAGEDEVVLVVAGSSARQTEKTRDLPVDASIMAVVDSINMRGQKVFEKFPEGR